MACFFTAGFKFAAARKRKEVAPFEDSRESRLVRPLDRRSARGRALTHFRLP